MADLRATEAETLVRAGNEQGAYYLGGMAVECALKACIAKMTREHEFPPKAEEVRQLYSHNLTELLRIAGLKDLLDAEIVRSPGLGANWALVRDWSFECRYRGSGDNGRQLSAALGGADGVLTWIRRHW